MRIAFHSNQLTLGGTEVALYDYANFSETLLGHTAHVFSKRVPSWPHHPLSIEKFRSRFPGRVHFYDELDDLESLLDASEMDLFYAIKSGDRDGVVSEHRKTCVHVVFRTCKPHGDVYAYVSEWLARVVGREEYPYVPHMIDLPDHTRDLRLALGIPPTAMVFGRYGSSWTFDIPFVKRAIIETVRKRKDVYFLFAFTDKFADHPQIIHLDGVADPYAKVAFINSCDAMIHARKMGESFGLAVGEFSSLNKPVITWNGGDDQAHLDMLGDRALKYDDYEQVHHLLNWFRPDPSVDYDCYSSRFNPRVVIKQFERVFLDG